MDPYASHGNKSTFVEHDFIEVKNQLIAVALVCHVVDVFHNHLSFAIWDEHSYKII